LARVLTRDQGLQALKEPGHITPRRIRHLFFLLPYIYLPPSLTHLKNIIVDI